jgi:hypothetical protein
MTPVVAELVRGWLAIQEAVPPPEKLRRRRSHGGVRHRLRAGWTGQRAGEAASEPASRTESTAIPVTDTTVCRRCGHAQFIALDQGLRRGVLVFGPAVCPGRCRDIPARGTRSDRVRGTRRAGDRTGVGM